MLLNQDCLESMRRMDSESFDMVYLDPPFYSQKVQKMKNSAGKEYVFSDVWESRADYLEYMRSRIYEIKRVLKSTGSVFLQCDTSASHYLRVLLDEVFGENNFRSEIIWSYKRWSNSRKGLLPAHQTILFYSKTNEFTFNPIYTDYSPTTNIDQILQARERNAEGKAVYKRDKNGEIINSSEKKGVPLSDVWEIPFLNPKAKERTGYPTQKPIELLERIIRISTNAGDIVLDPFCGSGTTLVAAKLLDRRYVGIDISADAIDLSKERLEKPFKSESMLLLHGNDAYKTKSEGELSILEQFDCHIVQRNKGIDAILKKQYLGTPIPLKIQKATESLQEAISLLDHASKKKRAIISVLITANNKIPDDLPIPQNMIILQSLPASLDQQIISVTSRLRFSIQNVGS